MKTQPVFTIFRSYVRLVQLCVSPTLRRESSSTARSRPDTPGDGSVKPVEAARCVRRSGGQCLPGPDKMSSAGTYPLTILGIEHEAPRAT